jgi:hypothetical protein
VEQYGPVRTLLPLPGDPRRDDGRTVLKREREYGAELCTAELKRPENIAERQRLKQFPLGERPAGMSRRIPWMFMNPTSGMDCLALRSVI